MRPIAKLAQRSNELHRVLCGLLEDRHQVLTKLAEVRVEIEDVEAKIKEFRIVKVENAE